MVMYRIELWKKIKANGIRQKEIADRVGISKGYVSQLFRGTKNSPAMLHRISLAIEEILKERS